MFMRTLAMVAFTASVGALALARPSSSERLKCTHETLTIKSTPVRITLCVPPAGVGEPGRPIQLPVTESFSSPKRTFSQTSSLEFLAGEEPSRVIEEVALEKLGINGHLHLTLVLRQAAVHVEGAMLTPGAITLK